MEVIVVFILWAFFCGTPIILTVFNVINLCKGNIYKEALIDGLTFVLGISFFLLLLGMWEAPDYTEAIVLGGGGLGLHTPIASWHMPTILTLSTIGVVGYILLRIKDEEENYSPFVTVMLMSAVYIGFFMSVMYIIQVMNNLGEGTIMGGEVFYSTLWPINYILCGLRLIRKKASYWVARTVREDIKYTNPILKSCQHLLDDCFGWYLAAFIVMLPLLGVVLIILILFGQKPDAIIRAFTETSDWTLSKEISPPPIEYDGHYLCTVALRGHEDLVKPTRYGIRHGKKIVVNRQLCVANAFEQFLEEKTPRFHRSVRNFYDTYGYPISKYIERPFAADITYLIMKPLEWIFLLVLYIGDQKPENRIALQYTRK